MHSQDFHSPNKASKPFWLDPQAIKTVEQSFDASILFLKDSDLLKFAASQANKEGLWVELGVAGGKTINFLANLFPDQLIYGFDSFEGLPEEWVRNDHNFAKGSYAQEIIPNIPKNVRLIKGLFKDTLSSLPCSQNEFISYLHIDCDLYSSTKESFDQLGSKLAAGTIIVFDEFYNYPGCEKHESKAFEEFLHSRPDLSYKIFAFNAMHEQVAVQLLRG